MSSDIHRLPVPNMYRVPEGMSLDAYLEYSIQQLEHTLIAQIDTAFGDVSEASFWLFRGGI